MIDQNLGLVDQTRENLRRVVRGMPARQRVYEEIKARASTRFAPMTIARIVGENNTALVAGSYCDSLARSRAKRGFQYVHARDPRGRNERTATAKDWVLNTSAHDDLTLEGSPEQMQKALVTMILKTDAMALAESSCKALRCRLRQLRSGSGCHEPSRRSARFADSQSTLKPRTTRPRGITRRSSMQT